MERAARSTQGRVAWMLALTALLLGGVLTIAVTSNRWKRDFRVARVTVEGNHIVAETDIVSIAAIPKSGKLYDIDLNGARMRVLQNPYIKSAVLARETPDAVAITVVERTPVAALVADRTLFIDDEGVVLPPVRSGRAVDLPVVTGELTPAECVPGQRVKSRRVREALEILNVARKVGDDLYRLISEVHCQGDSTFVLFTGETGVPVVFGRGDIPVKLVKLDGFWKQIVTQRGAAQLRTVDLRFVDQVVVRWDGTAQ